MTSTEYVWYCNKCFCVVIDKVIQQCDCSNEDMSEIGFVSQDDND